MASRNPYEALLPAWQRFCEERRACLASKVDHFTGQLKANTLIQPDIRMQAALIEWGREVDAVCGPYTTVEWPDDTRLKPKLTILRESPYVTGPCIVAGAMLFTDETYCITT